MTWWELLQTEQHSRPHDVIKAIDCPRDTQRTRTCPEGLDAENQTLLCEKCWNREVPEGWTSYAAAYSPPVGWHEEEEKKA